MAAVKRLKTSTDVLLNGLHSTRQPATRCCRRSMATEALPNATLSQTYADAQLSSTPTAPVLKDHVSIPPITTPSRQRSAPPRFTPTPNPFLQTATLTTHSFPQFEPISMVSYPSTHLLLPLRKDLLHRAVIYEGDMTRQGTASTKWRSEVHGSNRKIRPQKGTGSARLGDKKSPMLRGGGVAFGPKPRDFSTQLPSKIYDLAWRTALSYRYKKGEFLLLDSLAELPDVHPSSAERYVRDVLTHNNLGRSSGRTLFVTLERREGLFSALEAEKMEREARALECWDVDVKDLLELGRVVVERGALEWMLEEHEQDLGRKQRLGVWEKMMRGGGVPKAEREGGGEAVMA